MTSVQEPPATVPSRALRLAQRLDALSRILGMPLWGDYRILSAGVSAVDDARVLVLCTLEEGEDLGQRLGLDFQKGGVNNDYAYQDWFGVVADIPICATFIEQRPAES